MVSVFMYPKVNTQDDERTWDKRRSVLQASQVFTSGYVNTETILHFFKIDTSVTSLEKSTYTTRKLVFWISQVNVY